MDRFAVCVLAVALCSGCDGGQVLLVDVLTDFVRGREFTSVRTELIAVGSSGPEREETTPVFTEAGFSAFRVAELADVSSGEWLLRATLLDETGSAVASGRVQVDLSGAARVVTVVITRNCVDVMCGDDSVCVDGQCVDLSCSPENPDACPDGCTSDGECSATGPECVVGRCAEGICFEVPDDTLCGGGVCEAAAGCVGAPVDAGPPDAGPPDAGFPDAGPPDAGPPPRLRGVRELALGDRHSCAQLASETRCWGANDSGQHGNDSTTATTRPGAAVTSPVSELASGADHVCSGRGGLVTCWGLNADGQLGRGSPAVSTTPLGVTAGDMIGGALAVGRSHTCAPQDDLCVAPGPCDHNVWCWGANGEGQLGDGTRVGRTSPVLVDTDWQIVSAAAGDAHTCMVSNEGLFRNELFCWGANSKGQLGDATTSRRVTPNMVTLPDSPDQVVAGAEHTCVRASGDVRCFGDNDAGQVNPAFGATVSSPTVMDVGGAASWLAAGGEHSCAVVEGRVVCWGLNADGQLGDGTTVNRGMAVQAVGIDTAVAVFAGLAHTCAVLADQTVRCWGRNGEGQLGDGTRVSRPSPVAVLAP